MSLARLRSRRRVGHPISMPCSARHRRDAVACTRSAAVRSKTIGWKTSRVLRIPPSIASCSPQPRTVVGVVSPVTSTVYATWRRSCGRVTSRSRSTRTSAWRASSSVTSCAPNHGVDDGRSVKAPSSAARTRSPASSRRRCPSSATTVSDASRTPVDGAGRSEVSRASAWSASYAETCQGARRSCSASMYPVSWARVPMSASRTRAVASASTCSGSVAMAASRRRETSSRHVGCGGMSSSSESRPRFPSRNDRRSAARRWPVTYSTERPADVASATTAASVPATSDPTGASTKKWPPVARASSACRCWGSRSPTPRSRAGSASVRLTSGSSSDRTRSTASSTPASAATTS